MGCDKVSLVITCVCVCGGGGVRGGGGVNNVFLVIGLGGGRCDTVSLVILCVGGGGGRSCNKIPLVIVYVYICGLGVGVIRFRWLWGGGGGIKAAAKKLLHESHDIPAHDGAPHTKFGYKMLNQLGTNICPAHYSPHHQRHHSDFSFAGK